MFKVGGLTYLHIPKTGGCFTELTLRELYPQSYEDLGFHTTLREYEPSTPIISCIRNPFDWYVSLYFFNINISILQGTTGFKDSLKILLNPKEMGIQIKNPPGLKGSGWSTRKFIPISKMLKEDFIGYPEGRGYYSVIFDLMTGLSNDIEYMRFETLTEDLVSLLKDKSNLTPSQESTIRNTTHVNITRHHHYRKYYSDELIELVYEKDKTIFDRFGYEF